MPSGAIVPEYLPLAKLLYERLFRIPDYQRYYRWTARQRESLFKDIQTSYDAGRPHFMATMNVHLRPERKTIGTTTYDQCDVVDGQQRLTTLVILLKAIQKRASSGRQDQAIANELASLLVKSDDYSCVLLQTNHDSDSAFRQYVQKGRISAPGSATLATNQLIHAIRDCERFVDRWLASVGKLGSLVVHLKSGLTFVLHSVTDEKQVYTIFEVLNSRGLQVSWLDRMKSMLMDRAANLESAPDLIEQLKETWSEIYRTTGVDDFGGEVVRFAGLLQPDANKSLTEEDSVEIMLRRAGESPERIYDTARLLRRVTLALREVRKDKRRRGVTEIVHVRLVAAAATSWLSSGYSDSDRGNIQRQWENMAFRMFGLARRDARVHKEEFIRIARMIHHAGTENPTNAQEVITALERIGGDEYSIEKVVRNLRKAVVYDYWLNLEELQYFLYRYEEHLARESGVEMDATTWGAIWTRRPKDSIEHISPQSDEKAWRHGLENLLLMPLEVNTKMSNRPPATKATQWYATCGGRSAMEVARRIKRNRGGWTERDVVWRERILLKWALQEWSN